MACLREVFKENPKLLGTRSKDALLKRRLADHPGESEVPKSLQVRPQNVKSVLRSRGRRWEKGRPKQQVGAVVRDAENT